MTRGALNNRYFPAAPVQCSTTTGSKVSNGGAEAYIELSKALNILGDYRLSTACNVTRWAVPPCDISGASPYAFVLPHSDFTTKTLIINALTGRPNVLGAGLGGVPGVGGDQGSCCFAAAISLETSNGIEISGLNAEEQSDISFLCNWASSQVTGPDNVPSSLECYVYYDAMIVLEENNVVKLIQ